MSDLTATDKELIERVFRVDAGSRLLFDDRKWKRLVHDSTILNIDDDKYRINGNSMTEKLRQFLELEQNHIVGALLNSFLDYCVSYMQFNDSDPKYIKLKEIAEHLVDNSYAPSDDDSLARLMLAARDMDRDKNPGEGLLKMHTVLVGYIRKRCEEHKITIGKKPLHVLYEKYMEKINADKYIKSDMAKSIVSAHMMKEFNRVRNCHSLAHDNPILDREEAMLIRDYIVNLIHFIRALERGAQSSSGGERNSSA